jgi:peroxiredoxin Q/BCP
MPLEAGDAAPDFTLPSDSGPAFRLSAHRGAPVVLFFYPADDTEGCTLENLEYSALLPAFAGAGVRVVGISPDGIASHCAFRERHGLGVMLLADPDRTVIGAYGVWGLKSNYGRQYMGLIRTTFLIGPDGIIGMVYSVRRIRGHAGKVLEDARRLFPPPGGTT